MNFSTVILLVFTISMLLVVTSITLTTYIFARNMVAQVVEDMASKTAKLVVDQFDQFIKSVKYTVLSVVSDYSDEVYLQCNLGTYSGQKQYRRLLEHFRVLATSNNGIKKLVAYQFAEGMCFSESGFTKVKPGKNFEYEYYKKYFLGGQASRLDFLYRNLSDQEMVAFAFPLTNTSEKIHGCVVAYVPTANISRYLVDMAAGTNGLALLADEEGNILATSEGKVPQEKVVLPKGDEGGAHVLRMGDGTYAYTVQNTAMSGFKAPKYSCLFLLPSDQYSLINTPVQLGIIGLLNGVILMIGFAVVTFICRRYVFRPISRMIDAAKNTLDIPPTSGIHNDVGAMLDMLTHSIMENQQLKSRLYERQLYLQQAKVRHLMAQVNPHFLYNAIDSAQWLIEFGEYDQAKTMLGRLAGFYRRGIENDEQWVLLRSEIERIKDYLYIQSVRYAQRLEVRWEIQEEALDTYIVKMMIQPIVENAIRYSVERKGRGLIRIQSYLEGEVLYIIVTDDGVGISREQMDKLNQILDNPIPQNDKFFALHNIRWLIALCYGTASSLTIETVEPGGCKVTMRLQRTEQAHAEGQEYEI